MVWYVTWRLGFAALLPFVAFITSSPCSLTALQPNFLTTSRYLLVHYFTALLPRFLVFLLPCCLISLFPCCLVASLPCCLAASPSYFHHYKTIVVFFPISYPQPKKHLIFAKPDYSPVFKLNQMPSESSLYSSVRYVGPLFSKHMIQVESWDSETAEDNVLDGSIQQPRPLLSRSFNAVEYEIANPVILCSRNFLCHPTCANQLLSTTLAMFPWSASNTTMEQWPQDASQP